MAKLQPKPKALRASELARLSGLPLPTCWRWLEGIYAPSKLALERLAARGIVVKTKRRRAPERLPAASAGAAESFGRVRLNLSARSRRTRLTT
jgi:hypothetical protein